MPPASAVPCSSQSCVAACAPGQSEGPGLAMVFLALLQTTDLSSFLPSSQQRAWCPRHHPARGHTHSGAAGTPGPSPFLLLSLLCPPQREGGTSHRWLSLSPSQRAQLSPCTLSCSVGLAAQRLPPFLKCPGSLSCQPSSSNVSPRKDESVQ